MAKDGTNRGGARIGAGQKRKPLHDKVLVGNPGKRPLMVMEFNDTADLDGQTMPPPREFFEAAQKTGKQTLAVEIYEATWQWLYERRCAQLIPAQLLEQYLSYFSMRFSEDAARGYASPTGIMISHLRKQNNEEPTNTYCPKKSRFLAYIVRI